MDNMKTHTHRTTTTTHRWTTVHEQPRTGHTQDHAQMELKGLSNAEKLTQRNTRRHHRRRTCKGGHTRNANTLEELPFQLANYAVKQLMEKKISQICSWRRQVTRTARHNYYAGRIQGFCWNR